MLKRLALALAGLALAAAPLATISPASAVNGTCDPATRGDTYNGYAREYQSPDNSGYVLVEARWTWDGVSTFATGCNGPITWLHTRNTSQMPAWGYLPNKKKGNPWVQVDPGTDVTITSRGTLSNLGLTNYVDLLGDGIVFTDPAVSPPAAAKR